MNREPSGPLKSLVAGRAGAWGCALAPACLIVIAIAGCGHSPATSIARNASVPPGQQCAPYHGLPDYLEPAPEAPPATGGTYDDRIPVSGIGWRPTASVLAELRRKLAEIDLLVGEVAKRPSTARATTPATGAETESNAEVPPIDELAVRLRAATDEVSRLVLERPDLETEAQELAAISARLSSQRGVTRQRSLSRVEELTDLIRLQITVSSQPPN